MSAEECQISNTNLYYKCQTFTTASLDEAAVGSHVVVKHSSLKKTPEEAGVSVFACDTIMTNRYLQLCVAVVDEILVPYGKHQASHIALHCFEFLPELHPTLHVPQLKLPEERCQIVVGAQVS